MISKFILKAIKIHNETVFCYTKGEFCNVDLELCDHDVATWKSLGQQGDPRPHHVTLRPWHGLGEPRP